MFLMISQHEQPSSHPHHFYLAAISEAFDYDTVLGFLARDLKNLFGQKLVLTLIRPKPPST
jgi:hypothetical protein